MTSIACDTVIVGGGVVGLSIAYGFARRGDRVAVLDEGDVAFRAARGNFGLVWVQGKGAKNPDYARWTMAAAALWPAFAEELAAQADTDLQLCQNGGLSICLNQSELETRASELQALRTQLASNYPFEVLDAKALRGLVSEVGPEAVGAIYCPLDGHVSPLRLLHALVTGIQARRGTLLPGHTVENIIPRGGEFEMQAGGKRFSAGRVVLAAGLGNRALAPMVGLNAPVKPVRGQILVSERIKPFLRLATLTVRQTGEGVVQIGDSKEDVGFDDSTTIDQLAHIAHRAVRCFPKLQNANLVRCWGALRVMTPDGYPIYEGSAEYPGAYVITCHSGITLAAAHAGPLVEWMLGRARFSDIGGFGAERFHV
ncbi:FAD-binding oxidoreductase [Ferrovibrio sp.]|uniref:NAD(P)/FAD-dependent oxidoreductase n=1 Tax=Ferrovibrio sp. TaxID=1917215 RepID=UPI002637D7DE|nr:FAD-dependent oxidoreductase [Ferrovibrio sp.]